jgi:hypothetical protein
MASTALIRRVPDIGETFAVQETWWPWPHRYRVTSWLKKDRRGRMVFCLRDQAEYVSGSGVCGIIRRVEDVEIIGRVSWSEELIDEERRHAVRLAGQPIW